MKVAFDTDQYGKELLLLDDCKIIWRNFGGLGNECNHAGDRNFTLIIPDEDMMYHGKMTPIYDVLKEHGWPVKQKPSRNPDEGPFMSMKVRLKYGKRKPIVRFLSGRKKLMLDEEEIGRLDEIDIRRIDMTPSMYYWENLNRSGWAASARSLYVEQEIDRFASRWEEDEEDPLDC